MQTFTPSEYLMIDVANNYGLEKKLWLERIEWFKTNQASIEELARMEIGHSKHPLLKVADAPAQFYAGVKAWAATQRGEPTGHLIHLDATASGAQLLSLLVDCAQSGSNCNLVDTGERENLYSNLFEAVQAAAEHGLDALPEDVKRSIMTAFYGSKAQPKRVFGEGADLDLFYDTMNAELPGAWALTEGLIDLWQADALSHEWVMPDNFHVKIKVMSPVSYPFKMNGQTHYVDSYENLGTKRGVSLAANTAHACDGFVVREMGRRCDYNPALIGALRETVKEISLTGTYSTTGRRSPNHDLVGTLWGHYEASGMLSARILEVLDTENLHLVDHTKIEGMLATLPKKPFRLLSIHDAFACHPNYGNDVRRQYNRILSDIAGSEMLSFIISQIAGYRMEVNKYGGNLASRVLESNYSLS